MVNDEPRDDWGFTDADHAELQTLIVRHRDRLPDVMQALMGDGITPMPDDPGVIGWMARTFPDANTRMFPKGGMWWAMLDALRALDREDEKGGA